MPVVWVAIYPWFGSRCARGLGRDMPVVWVSMCPWSGSRYACGLGRDVPVVWVAVSTMGHIGGRYSPRTMQRGRDPTASPHLGKRPSTLGFDPPRATVNSGLKLCNDSVAFPIFDHHFPQEMTWKNGRKIRVCKVCVCVCVCVAASLPAQGAFRTTSSPQSPDTDDASLFTIY